MPFIGRKVSRRESDLDGGRHSCFTIQFNLYFDLRARKERLDADLLARRLDIEPGSVAAPPAGAPSAPEPAMPDPPAPAGDDSSGWAPPAPPGDVTPPSDWAPPRPPGVDDPER